MASQWKGEQFSQKLKATVSQEMSSLGSNLANAVKARAPKDTGKYANSIKAETPVSTIDGVSVSVYSDLKVDGHLLATILEYGTRDTEPKPHFRPAMDTNAPTLANQMIAKVNSSMK